jgi:Flp pilus assembly protein TadG
MHPTQKHGPSRGRWSVERGRPTPRRVRRRNGVTAVEFAIVAPIFLIMIFGIIEMGRALMVQQIITNASREGARRAIIEQATADEVKELVNDYLAATSVSGVTVDVSPAVIGPAVGFGDPVTVSVSVPFDSVSWMPGKWILGGTELSASTVMRAERAE